MIEVYYGKRSYMTPSTWNELKREQLLGVMNVLQQPVDEAKGLLMLLRIITRIPWWRFLLAKTPYLMDAAVEATSFLMEKNDLTKNLIPKYKGLYGPADSLSNLTMAEFCFTETFFSIWKHSTDEEYLDRLVAVLYRRKREGYNHRINPDGDHREKFNPNLIEYYRMQVEGWPKVVKQAIAHWYDGCRNQKIEENPKVFDGSGGQESVNGMWSVMRNVAKGGHFGDFDKVGEQYIDTILMELNEVVVEAERHEAEMKKMKRQ